MEQRKLKYYDDETSQFKSKVFTYLKQYMRESSDIAYIISTRDKLIAESGVRGADNGLLPGVFPISGEPNSKSSGVSFTFLQYFADYMNSRELLGADSTVLAKEAEWLAKLLLTSITEVAIVILMVCMAEIKLIKKTPSEQRPELLKKIRRDHVWMYGWNNFPTSIVYETRRGETCGLVLKIVDEEDNSKLLSDLDKHIVCRRATSVGYNGIVPGDSILWEDIPTFIKNDILGDGDN